jgi:hypothetical protein
LQLSMISSRCSEVDTAPECIKIACQIKQEQRGTTKLGLTVGYVRIGA